MARLNVKCQSLGFYFSILSFGVSLICFDSGAKRVGNIQFIQPMWESNPHLLCHCTNAFPYWANRFLLQNCKQLYSLSSLFTELFHGLAKLHMNHTQFWNQNPVKQQSSHLTATKLIQTVHHGQQLKYKLNHHSQSNHQLSFWQRLTHPNEIPI